MNLGDYVKSAFLDGYKYQALENIYVRIQKRWKNTPRESEDSDVYYQTMGKILRKMETTGRNDMGIQYLVPYFLGKFEARRREYRRRKTKR